MAKDKTFLDLHFVGGKSFSKVEEHFSLHQIIKSGENR